jgi:hypothetical protein
MNEPDIQVLLKKSDYDRMLKRIDELEKLQTVDGRVDAAMSVWDDMISFASTMRGSISFSDLALTLRSERKKTEDRMKARFEKELRKL